MFCVHVVAKPHCLFFCLIHIPITSPNSTSPFRDTLTSTSLTLDRLLETYQDNTRLRLLKPQLFIARITHTYHLFAFCNDSDVLHKCHTTLRSERGRDGRKGGNRKHSTFTGLGFPVLDRPGFRHEVRFFVD